MTAETLGWHSNDGGGTDGSSFFRQAKEGAGLLVQEWRRRRGREEAMGDPHRAGAFNIQVCVSPRCLSLAWRAITGMRAESVLNSATA